MKFDDSKDLTVEQIDSIRSMLKQCVNELCYQCGKYQQEHNGACDGCIYKNVRGSQYDGRWR